MLTIVAVPGHIKITGGQVFGGGKTLVEGFCSAQALDQFIRYRLAACYMSGVRFKHLGFHGPVFHDLRGQFDEILLNAGAAQARITDFA